MSEPDSQRRLLELAARAAGIALEWNDKDEPGYWTKWRGLPQWVAWNPGDDDGDALRLAVKLSITPLFGSPSVAVCAFARGEDTHPNPYTATRRAIVRAAAALCAPLPKDEPECPSPAAPPAGGEGEKG